MERVMRLTLMLLGLLLLVVGCYQTHEDGDLRAMPVTNNPNLTPQRDMGPMQAMPY